jgi:UTP--glucose-1-phosphate uridylyltransferase
VSKYGIINPLSNKSLEEGVLSLSSVVEKPAIDEAPSNFAIMGRYILTPDIFDILATLSPGSGNEIQLTDAIEKLNEKETVLAYNFSGKRYDVGDKFGFVKATIDFALERPDLSADVKVYLRDVVMENDPIPS